MFYPFLFAANCMFSYLSVCYELFVHPSKRFTCLHVISLQPEGQGEAVVGGQFASSVNLQTKFFWREGQIIAYLYCQLHHIMMNKIYKSLESLILKLTFYHSI